MSKLKGRKWTPAQKAKAAATRAFNRSVKERTLPSGIIRPLKGTSVAEVEQREADSRKKDTIAYLTSALSAQDRDYARCLIRLALYTLKGTT